MSDLPSPPANGAADPLLGPQNLPFLEEHYERYLHDPESVGESLRRYFSSLGLAGNGAVNPDLRPQARTLDPKFTRYSLFNPPSSESAGGEGRRGTPVQQDRVDQMIRAFRVRGHLEAQLDPLGRPRPEQESLQPEFYGLHRRDMDRTFSAYSLGGGNEQTLQEILDRLRNTYCRSIGVQFRHIDDMRMQAWLQDRMESSENRTDLSREQQLRILTRLTDAEVFEEFIRIKYTAAKSFSLEGGESLIPLLDLTIEKSAAAGVDDIVFGMAHRGRLNVLANVLGKDPQQIFHEFDDPDPDEMRGRGDVKYHLGYNNVWDGADGSEVRLTLCFNPSHLEFVNTVALGRTRARQDRADDAERRRGLCVLIHGDAAFAGEGVVQETLNLSDLEGYRTGGTLHIILNNQIGFTTNPGEGRSSLYASAVARMLQIPIFHVNGEDPEAVAQVVQLAVDFRTQWQRDVVIDLFCYRRHGHNENDEPKFTQPLMYRGMKTRPSVRDRYLERLTGFGQVTRDEADRIEQQRRDALEAELGKAREKDYKPATVRLEPYWDPYFGGPVEKADEVGTALPRKQLAEMLKRLNSPPEGFTPHGTIERELKARREMAAGQRSLNWAAAESLAIGTLAAIDKVRVRMSGQDSQRGTFSHRHAVLHDVENGQVFFPLRRLAADQAPVEIYNSPLSETGVLGFEYGYSLDCPDGLVLWEAQFGDFINVAQVIIDQFLASSEDKWNRLSGLVLLLPHGFDGMGPEHSSARLERFLQLAAEDNMQIVNLTTPAQYFHMLRRQVLRRWRKPVVMMSPKGLLRSAKSASPLEDLAQGGFLQVIPDGEAVPAQVKRVLLCSGQLYYGLVQRREDERRDDVAIVRLEQLYPLPQEELAAALAPYGADVPVMWVQEEPENMGAWYYLKVRFGDRMGGRPFGGAYRVASASPATGSSASHKAEQAELLDEAFGAPG